MKKTMEDIIRWLLEIENAAGRFFALASEHFKRNKELSCFLKKLAEDEAWHFRVMGSAVEFVRRLDDPVVAAITLDEKTKDSIEKPFAVNLKRLKDGTLTEGEMLECLVKTEFSEWNDIFLYVVNVLKKRGKAFQCVASKIENHKKFIKNSVRSFADHAIHVDALDKVSPVWNSRVLIVDDDEALANLLLEIFHHDNEVELAKNGKEALEKTKETFFDAVISDIDMPLMDGLAFFKEAKKLDPDIGRRFLFMSGHLSSEKVDFLDAENLMYLSKPARLNEIKDAIHNIFEAQIRENVPVQEAIRLAQESRKSEQKASGVAIAPLPAARPDLTK